jgi:predicted permease
MMRKLWRRFYFLLQRQRLERELAEEMAAHREMMPAERRGHFGNTTRLQEDSREVWSWTWLDQLGQDLAYGARMLRRAPGFTLGAIAVLALGVGVNLAEFQIFDAMIFHRLHIADADSVLQLVRKSPRGARLGFPDGAVEFYRAESRSFAWLVSEDISVEVTMEADSGLRSNLVSANYFDSLGVVPAWGRLLNERDFQPGAPLVAVLSYPYWQSHWGGDPNVVGRVVRINNRAVQIVGVLPYSFEGLMARGTVVWFPVNLRPVLLAGSPSVQHDFSRASEVVFGKLKSGVAQAAGEAELTALTAELVRTYPRAFREDERIQAHLVQDSIGRTVARIPAIFIFVVMILLVLLSACANLGNMLLARGLARQREIGIRIAIGAGRARVFRQLMTENLLLAALGSVAGLAFSAIAARLLMNALGAPAGFAIPMRWPTLIIGVVLTFLSAVAFGLPSALQTIARDHRKIRLRQSLVGVQVAVSCLLLIASGVLAHNGILSASIHLAFDYPNMVVVYPQLYGRSLPAAVARQKLDAMSARLRALPGVQAVAAAVAPPLGPRVVVDTLPGLPHVYRNSVAASYFELMNLPVVAGRSFLPGDSNVVIVSESAARAVWPNQNPVGRTWRLAGADRIVAGVVKDSGANLLADIDSIEAYLPMEAADVDRTALILHTRGDPGSLVRMIPAIAAEVDETVSVSLMRAGRDHFLETQRRMVTLFGSIGMVATALAAAGMFALVAFAVAQRKRELGIRIAIGAGSRHILGVLLAENLKPTAIGVVAGMILAIALSRLVGSTVVMPTKGIVDATGFAAGIVCFLLVAALATLSPARRALRIDPSLTLREE